ncbi:MAG: EAL domain-containing protein [Defluviitaleaceae bacterium]|nr:EAL domain-containing protein [Defluviitaleaceae bacterium]MCL2239951.1 EAL domain-containing protein [Defluviitaleaceae bacterium]
MNAISTFKQPEFHVLGSILEGKHIETVYQPIVSLSDGHVFGYEALSRITKKELEINIEKMFEIADSANRLWELETLCRARVLEGYRCTCAETKLFLNVNPNALYDEEYKKGVTKTALSKYGLNPDSIVFEITERIATKDNNAFMHSVQNYREQKYKIAIDDVGAGYSGLNAIASVKPDYIKLDIGLVRGIDRDEIKMLLCRSIVEFGKNTGIKIVAEGIETERELEVLVQMRVDLGQGYLLGIPQKSFDYALPENVEMIIKNHPSNRLENEGSLIFPIIGNFSKPGYVVSPDKKAVEIYEALDPSVLALSIVDDGITVGFLTRAQLDKKLGGRFGFDLYSRRLIHEIAETNFLKLDFEMSADQASRIAIQRPHEQLYDPIVVERNGRYYGIVTVKDLLEVCTKTEVEAAMDDKRHAQRTARNSEIARVRADAAKEAVMSSIEYASKIQKNLLPSNSIFESIFADYSILLNQRDIVGGDIYWIKNFKEGSVLCICDCTGHGAPGAMLTMLVVSILDSTVNEDNYKDTAEIVYALDLKLSKILGALPIAQKRRSVTEINDGCDLAVLFISNDGNVAISSGHTHVFICNGDEVAQIKGQKIYVGEHRLHSKNDVEITHIPYNSSNKFYIASDGLFDQIGGEQGLPFGYATFKKIILENHTEKQSVISKKIWNAFEKYRHDQPRRDDVELITFKPQPLR